MTDMVRKVIEQPTRTGWLQSRPAAVTVILAAVITVAACGTSATTSTAPSSIKCTIALATSPTALARGGGTGAVTVTTTPECAWTASSEANWIAGVAPASGQGNGHVEFLVAANPAATVRLADIVVNTSRIQVRQEASGCGFALATRSQTFSATGGPGAATLSTTPDGCSWTATSQVDWIAITSGEGGAGNGTVSFLVQANNGPERSGSLTIAGQTFTVREGGVAGSCTYALSPPTQIISTAGGAGTPVSMVAPAGCAWTASADVPWITIAAGGSGTGSGSIPFSVAANTGAARSGTITAGGQEVTVTQAIGVAPTCLYILNAGSQTINAAGGPGTPVGVSTSQGCGWSASANVSWIMLTGGSGTGSGTIAFSVAANTGAARRGTVTVTGGQGFTVDQTAAPAPTCSYSITPASQAMDESGGGGTVSVLTAAGCPWTAVSNEPWIGVVSGAAGNGNGSVSFSVMPNDDKKDKKRDGTMTIAGRTFTVSQSKK
jgi:hypothetical protein